MNNHLLLTFTVLVLAGNLQANTTDPLSPYFTPEPIQLDAFEARGIDEGVILYWDTVVEWEADSYIVERSSDGTDWTPIGELAAGGNNIGQRSYLFVDETPFIGMNHYRLVQRDYYGNARVSDYLDIQYDGMYDPAIFPNPVPANGIVNVRFYGFENQELQIDFIDLNGRRLDRRSFDLTEGPNTLQMPTPPSIRNGMYLVRLSVDDYPVTSYRVLVRS